MRDLATIAVGFSIVLCAAACSDSPTVAPATATDHLSGTVQVGSHDFHNFTVSKTGNISVTLTQAGPPSSITVGLGVGIPDASGCPTAPNATVTTSAGASPILSGTLAAGTYCLDVFDVGNQTAPITY